MKRNRNFKFVAVLTAFSGLFALTQTAHALPLYELTLTNGTDMPISPGVIYAISGEKAVADIGDQPSAGLIQLCQTGNPSTLAQEIKANSKVTWSMVTHGPLLPGQSATYEVDVPQPAFDSLHFAAMYGKSKDACAMFQVNSHAILALREGQRQEIIRNDQPIVTGAFTAPSVPAMADSSVCAQANSAVDCLRTLSSARMENRRIRPFPGYLPSILNFLESRYGAEDAQSLLIPPTGGLRYSLKRKTSTPAN